MVLRHSIRPAPWLGALSGDHADLPFSQGGQRFAKLFACTVKAHDPYIYPNNIPFPLQVPQPYWRIGA